jgi:hypothetical protein
MGAEKELYNRVVELKRTTRDLVDDVMALDPTIELCLFAGKLGSVLDVLDRIVSAGVPVPESDEPSHQFAVMFDEGDRQMAILALAHLSVERPGWDDALNRLASRIDNVQHEGRAIMYDEFRRLHRGHLQAQAPCPSKAATPGDAAFAEMEAVADDEDG